jgi:hypothetical protein
MPNENPRDDPDPIKPLPHCKALLLCERVTEHRVTGALTLRNLIESFRIPAYTRNSTPFAIFVQLYDGIGRYHLTIEVYDLSDDSNVARATFADLDFPERLAKIDAVIPVDAVWLPRPGRYEVLVLADRRELSRQSFVAEIKNDPE